MKNQLSLLDNHAFMLKANLLIKPDKPHGEPVLPRLGITSDKAIRAFIYGQAERLITLREGE